MYTYYNIFIYFSFFELEKKVFRVATLNELQLFNIVFLDILRMT